MTMIPCSARRAHRRLYIRCFLETDACHSRFGTAHYIRSPVPAFASMPLNGYLAELDRPVQPEEAERVISYMQRLAPSKETLVMQCAEHLEQNKTLSALLTVAYALNEGEILMRCQDDDTTDLVSEFDRLLQEDDDEKK